MAVFFSEKFSSFSLSFISLRFYFLAFSNALCRLHRWKSWTNQTLPRDENRKNPKLAWCGHDRWRENKSKHRNFNFLLVNQRFFSRTYVTVKKRKKETTKVSLFRSGFRVCIPTNNQEGKDFQQGIDLRTIRTITLSRFATANNWTCPLILHSRP